MKYKGSPLFSINGLDRSSQTRQSEAELNSLLEDNETRHAIVWRGRILFHFSTTEIKIGYLSKGDKFWKSLRKFNFFNGYFVGYHKKIPIFYHDVSNSIDLEENIKKTNVLFDNSEQTHVSLPKGYVFRDLKSIMTTIAGEDASISATIKGIYEWNTLNKFCGRCGQKNQSIQSGWEKRCTACNSKHFPRIDPVVIMLICRKNYTLLGRSQIWPAGMFSCLAGFMEPGEAIEAAVARETFEEAGIKIKNTKYIISQPWPFPSALMIGCYTESESYELEIDKNELEDAKWFSKEEVYLALNNKASWWPARQGSIARFMIEAWATSEM